MNIKNEVIRIITELSGEKSFSNEATLQGALLLDSLRMVTLLIEIENAFDIELDESDMNPLNLVTVQDVIDMVKTYLDRRGNN